MRQSFLFVSATLLVAACIEEADFTFQGTIPDGPGVMGDAETVSLDGTGDLGVEVVCQPKCEGRECGWDGCDGVCGECDDGNPCTTDSCDAKSGKCQFLPVEGAGDEPGCDDSNPCTTDSCNPQTGKCQNVPVADGPEPACENETKCDGAGVCKAGVCAQDLPLVCDDENPCTTDSCDPADGLCDFVAVADGPELACDNGDPCDGPGVCESGSCTQGTPVTCDDSNPCTTDSCNQEDGQCVFTAVEDGDEVACDDGNPCTKDLCTGGACDNPLFPLEDLVDEIAGGQCLCTTDEDCTKLNDDDLCNGTLHCVAAPDDGEVPVGTLVCLVEAETIKEGTFDDGLWCNGLETCDPATGEKVAGTAPTIDDGIECTIDACYEEGDVVLHTPDFGKCDDGNECSSDSCDPASGCVNQAVSCDDSNLCTNDGCDYKTGCFHTPVSCTDDNACNGLEGCDAAKGCQAGTPLVCDDGLFCNGVETCDLVTGCKAGTPPVLSDAVNCTIDACDEDMDQVTHTPDDSKCADAQACTTDVCSPAMGCQHLVDDVFCDDGNPCTEDSCDPKSGCIHSVAPLDATPCDDGDPCTKIDVCTGGQCIPGPYDELTCGADFDHDGLEGAADSCPYAFDPQQLDLDADGKKDACEPLPAGFTYSRPLVLSQAGQPSTWRRTHEPVEVPLANGIVDDSVLLHLKLDGSAVDSSQSRKNATNAGAVTSAGAFGAGSVGMRFDGDMARILVDDPSLCPGGSNTPFTTAVWFNADKLQFGNLAQNVAPCSGLFLELEDPGTLHLYGCKDATCSVKIDAQCGEYTAGEWHHFAVAWDGEVLLGYMDGKLACTEPLSQLVGFGAKGAVSLGGNSAPVYTYPFLGVLDEFLIWSRALTPDEIETYYRSHAPYGTKFAPEAQADFDDVRVTEKTGTGDPIQTGEAVKRTRILGPRPHSDTPCPMGVDDGTWKDRDDLCGVVGYWRLDGDAKDVTGKHDGVNNGAVPAMGRFGDGGGSFMFDGPGGGASVEVAAGANATLADFTAELWFRVDKSNEGLVSWGRTYLLDTREAGTCSGNAFTMLMDVADGEYVLTNSFDVPGVGVTALHVPAPVRLGRWHHMAFLRRSGAFEVYFDGIVLETKFLVFDPSVASIPASVLDVPWFLGRACGGSYGLNGALDDVLIHSVAKSADYIYHRANPGVPKVQLLANTVVLNQGTEQAPAYPMREYAMYWGDAAAKSVAPFVSSLPDAPVVVPDKCYGLLNGCMGYAGWWRFNEGRGTVAVDSSGWKNNGGLTAQGWSYTAGQEGTGLYFAGSGGFVTIPNSPIFVIPNGAIELSVAPGQAVNGNWSGGPFVLWKEVTGFADDWYAYFGADDGKLGFRIDAVGGVAQTVMSDQSVWAEGQSHPVAFSFGSGGMKMHVDHLIQKQTRPHTGGVGGSAVLGVGANLHLAQGEQFFKGTLDGLRMSSRALTPDEFLHYPLVDWAFGSGNWVKDCGGIICPELAGYDVTCNPQDHCEYANKDEAGWKKWDVWIFVPPGKTRLGSPTAEGGHSPDEEDPGQPDKMHPVTFTKGFFVAKFEIVVEQYEACMADGAKCTLPTTTDFNANGWGTNSSTNSRKDHPQNGLKWQQAKDFCAWAATGGRLLSEAEWEYAAKGPLHRKYPWGDVPAPTCSNGTAVFNEMGGVAYGCGSGGTMKEGTKETGAAWCGALDMAGNVWEWVEDWYHNSYDGAPSDGSAWVAPQGMMRSVRGGSLNESAAFLRAADRYQVPPDVKDARQGARCARPLLPCPPSCAGKQCGDDGCGGSCGECDEASGCTNAGQCTSVPGIKWIPVQAGVFSMGCSAGDGQCDADELPAHPVAVSAFKLLETEITQAQFQLLMGENPSAHKQCSACPVEMVTKGQAQEFCMRLGGRLPSEAEWEYAARAGTTTKYICGSDLPCVDGHGWTKENSGLQTHPVKGKQPNAFGLFDMVGNVYEWVEDCYHPSFDGAPSVGYPAWLQPCEPTGTGVPRGGAYFTVPDGLRASYRDPVDPSAPNPAVGIRCVRVCAPSCAGKQCGDDGCGGSCGECGTWDQCTAGKCQPTWGGKWMPIPAAPAFQMGCSPGDDSCLNNEKPPHPVNVKAFEILETEVTEAQYQAVTSTNPSCKVNGGGGPNAPVECTGWSDALKFCQAVGGRLPSEAEWELAARGGTTTKYACGTQPACLPGVAWYVSNSSSHKFDVKQKAANGYGLYDMFGNVWEWTEDWYHSDYNGAPATGYPGWTSPADTVRVLRGAGFLSLESYLSSSFRGVGDPGGGSEIGFRCVRQH